VAGDSRFAEFPPQPVRVAELRDDRRLKTFTLFCSACLSGEQHASWVLYGRHNGKRFGVYVPEDLAPRVQRAAENGRALEDLLVPRHSDSLVESFG
jgi:hypothetical protein